ncbi:MAG: glycosyltransferase [Geobacteraceae bacterium]|nr:glycosyltransferase [Geobacteraceae bacterium]
MSCKRLKILHVTYEIPFFPGGSGGQTRQFNLLNNLSERHDIDYIGPRANSAEFKILKQLFRKIMIPERNFFLRQAGSVAKRIARSYPSCVRKQEGMRLLLMPLVKKALKKENYDIINIEHTNSAHWLAPLKTTAKKIVVAHNVKSVMWERYFQQSSGDERHELQRDYLKFEKYEKAYLKFYDGIIAMSETDKGYVHNLCGNELPVHVIPNGVDVGYFTPLDSVVEPSTIVFTGTMDHPPNNEGIQFFCKEIFSGILAKEPNAKLLIVGNSPSQDVQALADGDRVTVTGFVPDIRPYIASASVIIVPLLTGSGTRLKILESMAMGKAIVSTSIGAEGISCSPGENILLADTPEEFTRRVLELMANQNYSSSVGNKAREIVCEEYSWKNLSHKLEDVYRSYSCLNSGH